MNIPRKIPSFFLVLTLLAGLLGLAQPVQASVPLMAELWVTDGTVYATLLSGSTLYIGGEFSYVGPSTGGFAALDASGAPDLAFPPVDGEINAVAPDGAGGWYVGGSFTQVGGHPRNNLAHLKADHSLDFTWNPNPNSPVHALAVAPPISGAGGSTLYVGGEFTSIGGQIHNRIAALDASTGSATSWNPNADNIVYALAAAPGSTIYAGGKFTGIGGQPRSYIAALDASTGLATDWNPSAHDWSQYPDGKVRALAVAPPTSGTESPTSGMSNSTIYVGGRFTGIGGQARRNIAALDASTGLATNWNPGPTYYRHDAPVEQVYALAVAPPIPGASGSTIYAGGFFDRMGGQLRENLAALDASTGLAIDWNLNTDNPVNALGVAPPISGVSGSTIYVGGSFHRIGGQFRNHIAALNTSTGLITDWNPNVNDTVLALASAPPISGISGSTVAIGGWFGSIGGQTRNHIAALDINTGRATTWNPNANGNVYALTMSGSTLYAGGAFTSIGGQGRNRIAALDASTGSATPWNPNADNTVRVLALSGSTLYAGGDFTSIGGQGRNRIAALDAGTGSATSWNPNADNTVRTLTILGGTLYAGGAFTEIGGQTRNHVAALDASSGLATSWNPNADYAVDALVAAPPIVGVAPPIVGAAPGGTIYAGGWFNSIGGQTRNYLAALDLSTGLATDWNPDVNGIVYTLAVAPPISGASSSTIYAGGWFDGIGGQPRTRIAALDISTGSVTNWNPNASNAVYTLTVAPPTLGVNGSIIYVGGSFTNIAGRHTAYIAGLRDGTATCQSAGSGGSWQVSHWSNCGNTIPNDGDSVVVQNGHALTLYGSLAANDLTVNAGGALELPPGSSLSVEGSVTHNGRLAQTLAVPATATTPFLNLKNAAGTIDKFFGASLTPEVGGATPEVGGATPAGDMGYTRVSISGNQNCTSLPGDQLIKRCFNITPTTAQNATLRLYYTHAELNSQTYNTLKLWHWSSGWAPVGDGYTYSATCGVGQSDCWMEAKNVSGYLSFVLGSQVHTMRWFMPLLRR